MAGWKNRIAAAVSAVLLLSALAACGEGNGNNGAPSASGSASPSAAASPSQQPEASKAADSGGETRVVKDEFGEVTIPAHPQRVAGIYVEDYLKALGVTPVVQWYNPNWGKQDYLALDAPLFDNSGSVEPLLAYNPDLIIVDGGVDKEMYANYSKVAPTYRLPESVLQDSRQILTAIGDVLGIPDKAAEVLAAYNARVEEAKRKLASSVGKQTVAVIRVNTADRTIALFGVKNRYAGEFLFDQLGLEPHPLVKNMTEFQQVMSEEGFAALDADNIIVFPSNGTWDSPENQEAFKLLDSPLWKNVPAFKNGHVYKVERSHWQSGGITANLMKIDDLLKFMAK